MRVLETLACYREEPSVSSDAAGDGADELVDEADPYARLEAMFDRALTDPVLARDEARRRWAPATAKMVVTEWPRFRNWCRPPLDGRAAPERWLTPLPCTRETLALYVLHQVQQGRAPATIRKAKAAILAMHRIHGQPLPDGLPALSLLQEYERTLKEQGKGPQRAEQITLEQLLQILAAVDRGTVRGIRDASILMLTFAGMLGTAELPARTLGDVALVDAGLRLNRGADGTLIIGHWTLDDGTHHPLVCPVEVGYAWPAYLISRDQAPNSPLIRAVATGGRVAGIDPFSGRCGPGGRLSTKRFCSVLDRMLDDAGIVRPVGPDGRPARINMISLRLGGIVHRRRRGGETIAELATAAGLSTVRSTLLTYLIDAEQGKTAPATPASEPGGTPA